MTCPSCVPITLKKIQLYWAVSRGWHLVHMTSCWTFEIYWFRKIKLVYLNLEIINTVTGKEYQRDHDLQSSLFRGYQILRCTSEMTRNVKSVCNFEIRYHRYIPASRSTKFCHLKMAKTHCDLDSTFQSKGWLLIHSSNFSLNKKSSGNTTHHKNHTFSVADLIGLATSRGDIHIDLVVADRATCVINKLFMGVFVYMVAMKKIFSTNKHPRCCIASGTTKWLKSVYAWGGFGSHHSSASLRVSHYSKSQKLAH